MNEYLQLLAILLCLVPAVLWSGTWLQLLLNRSRLRSLDEMPAGDDELPNLAVVIAARDEERKIRAALASLLQQDYPGLRVIAVDDRSSDGTSEILQQLAADEPRLEIIRIDQLPEGWLGKNHALQSGLLASDSDYVLFTDADVHFGPTVLRRALRHAVENELDHFAALPRLIDADASMKLMIPAFAVFFMLITRPWKIEDPESDAAIGVGAFNLFRRAALVRAGGLEPIRLRPDDDLMLGQLLKQSGGKAGFALAGELLSVEWYRNAGETIRGLEKNCFAQFEYSVARSCSSLLASVYVAWLPLAGLAWLPGPAGWCALLATVAMLGLAMQLASASRLSPWWGLAFPAGCLLLFYAGMRSMVVTLRRGGIDWRGTFYPLELLRRNRI